MPTAPRVSLSVTWSAPPPRTPGKPLRFPRYTTAVACLGLASRFCQMVAPSGSRLSLPACVVLAALATQWPRGAMGYNIFTKLSDGSSVRYTEWVEYKDNKPVWEKNHGVELYNLSKDPNENVNVVKDPSLAKEVNRLSRALHDGWRAL